MLLRIISWFSKASNRSYAIIALLSFLWIITILPAFSSDIDAAGHVLKETGELAWKLLAFTVFIGLLSKIFVGNGIIMMLLPLRKYTGIFAFCIAFSHLVFFLLGKPPFSLEMTSVVQNFSYISGNYSLTFGMIALLGMLLPFITSTLWAVKKLGPAGWKNVQRLTHIAFIFVPLHIAFLPYIQTGSIEWGALFPLVLYGTGYAYVFWKKQNPPKIEKIRV